MTMSLRVFHLTPPCHTCINCLSPEIGMTISVDILQPRAVKTVRYVVHGQSRATAANQLVPHFITDATTSTESLQELRTSFDFQMRPCCRYGCAIYVPPCLSLHLRFDLEVGNSILPVGAKDNVLSDNVCTMRKQRCSVVWHSLLETRALSTIHGLFPRSVFWCGTARHVWIRCAGSSNATRRLHGRSKG